MIKTNVQQHDHFAFHMLNQANEEAANLLLSAFVSQHEGDHQTYVCKTVEEDLTAYVFLLASTGGSFSREEMLDEETLAGTDGKARRCLKKKKKMKVWVMEERIWGPRP